MNAFPKLFDCRTRLVSSVKQFEKLFFGSNTRGEILPVRLKKWFFNALKKRQKRIVQICGITV